MKGRESGMPDEEYWATFFDPVSAIGQLLRETEYAPRTHHRIRLRIWHLYNTCRSPHTGC